MLMTKKRFFLCFCIGCVFLCVSTAWAAVSLEELERQEFLAMEYRLALARLPSGETEAREALYLRLIDECPETEAAEEALWALTNLYLDDFDEPQPDKARQVLERFLERHPSSPWLPHVESRLLWLYEGTENHARVLELFENVLKHDMPIVSRLPLALRCAQRYEAAGQPDKAKAWYARILNEAGTASYPEVAVARARLAELEKKKR